jgi:AcrR family transcriptional regulator
MAAASDPPEAHTRDRLLDAAGEIFADHGFRDATVRDICQRANANVAAVNYHFGSKQGLYNAALREHVAAAAERHPIEPEPDADPRRRLELFVDGLLRRIMAKGESTWHGRLMMREMAEPTEYTDEHIARFVRPTMAVLDRIVRDWLGLGEDQQPELRRRLIHSCVGQVMFFWQVRQLMPRVHPELVFDEAEVRKTAGHITAVMAAALDVHVTASA